jgi:deoxyribonuclease-1-like protein
MRRLLFVLLLATAGGGWYFFQKYRIEGFDRVVLKPREPSGAAAPAENPMGEAPLLQRAAPTIRIASFDLGRFDAAKLGKPPAMKALVELLRRFDVIALQNIATPRDDLMAQVIEQLNSTGRHYDYVIGPRLGRDATPEQLAYVFDAASVEVDRSTMYTVEDPGRLMRRDPLVATFRVRGPDPRDAFTFTLVNVHVDPQAAAAELDALANVYRAVRNSGLGEDDIILVGDLGADDRHLGLLGQLPNMTAALAAVPTNTRGTRMLDNILFNRDATIEYTGRAGVVDLQREFNLTMPQALELSDHLPIWAEFSIFEGGQPGRLAAPTEAGPR